MAGSVSLLSRGMARSVDLVLALAMAEALPTAGWFGGMLYLLAADGLSGGQSVGKRLLGLRVIGREGALCSLEESLLRNADFALALLLWKLPVVGWIVLAAVVVLEGVIIIGSADALRIGDELAGTRVVPGTWQSETTSETAPTQAESATGSAGNAMTSENVPPATAAQGTEDNSANTVNKEESSH